MKGSYSLIFSYILLGLFMIPTTHGSVTSYKYSVFPGLQIVMPCSPGVPSSWTFTASGSSQAVPLPQPPNTSYIFPSQLAVMPSADTEGIYTCLDSSGRVISTSDISVLGLAKFTGCPSQSVCDNNVLYSLSEGRSIPPINISFDFYNGGSRNEKQLINFVFIRNPDNVQIASCKSSTMKCFDLEGKGLISFPVKEEYNTQVVLSSRSVEDSGVYSVEAELYTTHSRITTITSYFSVTVTATSNAAYVTGTVSATGTGSTPSAISTTGTSSTSSRSARIPCSSTSYTSTTVSTTIPSPNTTIKTTLHPSFTSAMSISSRYSSNDNHLHSSSSLIPFSVTIAEDNFDYGTDANGRRVCDIIAFTVSAFIVVTFIVLIALVSIFLVRRQWRKKAKVTGSEAAVHVLSSIVSQSHENGENKQKSTKPAEYEIPLPSLGKGNAYEVTQVDSSGYCEVLPSLGKGNEYEVTQVDSSGYCEVRHQQQFPLLPQRKSAERENVQTIVRNITPTSLPREANSDTFMI